MLDIDLSGFIKRHQLPDSYNQLAQHWFTDLANDIVLHHNSANRPFIVGINGAQGSGKSTLADLLVFILEHHFKLNTVALSLDDFYLTQQERLTLSQGKHPLFATRGVPGTHDINLALKTITQLKQQTTPVQIPRFNKAVDDRYPLAQWQQLKKPVDIIVLEGWCLGSEAQTDDALVQAVNSLEEYEDPDLQWRRYVNEQLASEYPKLFQLIDQWVMLKAPSFDCVFNWRLEQENKLRQLQFEHTLSHRHKFMDDNAVQRFIKFYQRITEHTLNTLPAKVDYLYKLDDKRNIITLKKQHAQNTTQWLIFTDLDGSLLDHHNYSHEAADALLTQLAIQKIPVIPVSSKTAAELELIRASLNNQHPFIIENGAAVYIPIGYFEQQPEDTQQIGNFWVKQFVDERKHWQQLIQQLKPKYLDQFKTFSELGIDGIIALTGLNVHTAARAAKRQFGEPISWQGNGNLKQQFIDEIEQLGGHVLQGGRFIHVSGQCDKGKALEWLHQLYLSAATTTDIKTLAIGDSHNDKAMLEQADYALLIRSPAHSLPEINRDKHLFVSTQLGPKGWSEGVKLILDATLHLYSSDNPRGNHG